MKHIEIENRDGVALATMNNGENRLNAEFTAELRETLSACEADASVKALAITGGHEKYFCNGLDLAWMMEQDGETLTEFLIDVTRLLKETALFGKPLIGAINGHAFGLGCIWSSGFDFRLMREDRGWACFPEMDINIPFLPGMIAICSHGLGNSVFREMAWTAKRYTGPEAVEVGWARSAAPAGELLDKSLELAKLMGMKQQPAFGLTKKRWAAEVARIIDELDPEAIRSAPLPGKK